MNRPGPLEAELRNRLVVLAAEIGERTALLALPAWFPVDPPQGPGWRGRVAGERAALLRERDQVRLALRTLEAARRAAAPRP